LERAIFLGPIAHRGLHDPRAGRIENSAPAFGAAIARGYGIECDLRPAADGTPIVFHDPTLDRLVDATGRLDHRAPAELRNLCYRGTDSRIMGFADLLDLVGGRVPVLAEIKSCWTRAEPAFLGAVAALAREYRGPLAVMSFDPASMAALRELAPAVPRGLAAGLTNTLAWPDGAVDEERARRLGHLLESRAAAPDFYAYHVHDLPTPVTRYVREVQGIPLLAWTVRSEAERQRSSVWSDGIIFEGFEPTQD
jgi:glycerophosphoryl diester phosphodiesterase